jgi:hypothetical protein
MVNPQRSREFRGLKTLPYGGIDRTPSYPVNPCSSLKVT